MPADLDRKAMTERLARVGQGKVLTRWRPPITRCLTAGARPCLCLQAAELARHAKISVGKGQVSVQAITDSPREKVDLVQNALNRARAGQCGADAGYQRPRPVISPFTLRFVKDAAGRASTPAPPTRNAARDRILGAATVAGVPEKAPCTLAFAPSTRWADAAVAAIGAVQALGAGR